MLDGVYQIDLTEPSKDLISACHSELIFAEIHILTAEIFIILLKDIIAILKDIFIWLKDKFTDHNFPQRKHT